jgi:hypothetical protein
MALGDLLFGEKGIEVGVLDLFEIPCLSVIRIHNSAKNSFTHLTIL